MDLHNYLYYNIIGKTSSLVSTYAYDSFNRKHITIKYIGV